MSSFAPNEYGVQQFPGVPSKGPKYGPVERQTRNPDGQKTASIDTERPPKKTKRGGAKNKKKKQTFVRVARQCSPESFSGSHVCGIGWSGHCAVPVVSPFPGGKVIDISGFREINSAQGQNAIICDDEDGTFIAAKAHPELSAQAGGKGRWDVRRGWIPAAMACKPNLDRGEQNKGSCTKYVCYGYHKDRRKSGVIVPYAFKTGTSQRRGIA